MTLAPGEDPPALRTDLGVPLPSDNERRLHAPDLVLLVVHEGAVAARASCWWNGTPAHPDGPLGVIGHYAAADSDAGRAVLAAACDVLTSHGCATAVGPMDGTTWRRYRLIVERGTEPPFFLEPDNPDGWPAHWTSAGFETFATYTSAVTEDLDADEQVAAAALARLARAGVHVRAFDPARAEQDLRRIFALSLRAFSRNLLYSPISEEEFLAQNRAILPYVQPELVLLAERGSALAGYVFAVPDVMQAGRGAAVDTAILKTLAVDPEGGGVGLGGALVVRVQQAARGLGFRRAIHALMHETNRSQRISARYARTIRRYALFARRLQP